jgi:hypothetical protein
MLDTGKFQELGVVLGGESVSIRVTVEALL